MPTKPRYAAPVDAKTIGENLRRLRKDRGITQVELAKALSMPQGMISEYELGKARINGSLLAAFVAALNVSADEILGIRPPGQGQRSDRRFLRRLDKIERLPKRQKQLLLGTIDAVLKSAALG